jgi:hypothetical protein
MQTFHQDVDERVSFTQYFDEVFEILYRRIAFWKLTEKPLLKILANMLTLALPLLPGSLLNIIPRRAFDDLRHWHWNSWEVENFTKCLRLAEISMFLSISRPVNWRIVLIYPGTFKDDTALTIQTRNIGRKSH